MPSRFLSLREASRKRKPDATISELEAKLSGYGIEDDATPLALHVDHALNTRVWNGAQFEDRIGQFKNMITRSTIDEMEKSIMAQEDYDSFRNRLFQKMGIEDAYEGKTNKAIADLETRVIAEGRLGWNEAVIQAHKHDTDTALIWQCRLLTLTGDGKGSTPGCVWRHGKQSNEMPDDELPRHWKCYCMWITIPNPYSADEEIAAEGQAIIASMAADRAQWFAENGVDDDTAAMMEAERGKPSRFLWLREVSRTSRAPMPQTHLVLE